MHAVLRVQHDLLDAMRPGLAIESLEEGDVPVLELGEGLDRRAQLDVVADQDGFGAALD